MTMLVYPCEKAKDGMCEHGGNKNFNYGFVRGSAPYCRLKRQWVSDLERCPKEDNPDKL